MFKMRQSARSPFAGPTTCTLALLATTLPLVPCSISAADSTVQVSIAVRETFFNGGPQGPIGSDGGTTGGIEWINLDGQTLTLDGTWQTFGFSFLFAPVTAFAGSTANSILEGTGGTLEHIRIKSTGTTPGAIVIQIDQLLNTTGLQPPIQHVVQNWEAFSPPDVVTFNRPRFSGSTFSHLAPGPDVATVDDSISFEGNNSYRFKFRFVDNDPSRWVRLTTAFAPNQPNPIIHFSPIGAISFRMRGFTTCSADLNYDGIVDVSDLLMLLEAWGPAPNHEADLDGSGGVDVSDLLQLLGEWGACPN